MHTRNRWGCLAKGSGIGGVGSCMGASFCPPPGVVWVVVVHIPSREGP
jgi:hypothetical protein